MIPPAVHRENQGCVNSTCKARKTPTPILSWFINEGKITQFDDSRFKVNWITIGCHEKNFPVISPHLCVRRQDLAMPNLLQSLYTLQQPQQITFLEGLYYCGHNNLFSDVLDLVGEQRWFNLIFDMKCSKSQMYCNKHWSYDDLSVCSSFLTSFNM